MEILKSYKFRLKTNTEIKQKLAQAAGCCRFVWNKALAIQKERMDERDFWLKGLALNSKRLKFGCLFYEEIALKLVYWKKEPEIQFLKECPSQILQQTLIDQSRAIKDALNKDDLKKFPVFKKKDKQSSFRFPVSKNNVRIDNRRVKLPKIGWIGFFKSKDIKGTLKNVTISKTGKYWFVSFQTKQECRETKHINKSEIGIDLGVKKFATLSNREKIYPINAGKKIAAKLAVQQRKLARKIKFSSNWRKQKEKINRLHQKIKNCRHDFLHKKSSEISKNHAIIFLEDLKIKNMTKSAKGTKEKPGKNVKAKSGLNKSILDQGWYEFRRQLEYKSSWNGGSVNLVNPKNTSRRCPKCGFTHAENRKTQKNFVCLSCQYFDDADYVAALNILAAGQHKRAVAACGEATLVASTKQEPVGTREVVPLHGFLVSESLGIPFL